jgi:hypothetical protein
VALQKLAILTGAVIIMGPDAGGRRRTFTTSGNVRRRASAARSARRRGNPTPNSRYIPILSGFFQPNTAFDRRQIMKLLIVGLRIYRRTLLSLRSTTWRHSERPAATFEKLNASQSPDPMFGRNWIHSA